MQEPAEQRIMAEGRGAEEPVGEHRSARHHPTLRQAGVLMILLFVLIPPVAGSFVASVILSIPHREPWVISGAFMLGVSFFLLATPLGHRSDGFRVASYRRLTETAVLLGLTCGVVVAYTVLVHIIVGFQSPWAITFLRDLVQR